VLIAGIEDVATNRAAGDERFIELHPEPGSELLVIRESTPDPPDRSF
jgi:hypothetical protein